MQDWGKCDLGGKKLSTQMYIIYSSGQGEDAEGLGGGSKSQGQKDWRIIFFFLLVFAKYIE